MLVTSDVGSRLASPARPDRAPWPDTCERRLRHRLAEQLEAVGRVHRPGRGAEAARRERVAADRLVGPRADDEARVQRPQRHAALVVVGDGAVDDAGDEPVVERAAEALRRGQRVVERERHHLEVAVARAVAPQRRAAGERRRVGLVVRRRRTATAGELVAELADRAGDAADRCRGRAAGRRPTSPSRRPPAGRCRPGAAPGGSPCRRPTRRRTGGRLARRRRRRRRRSRPAGRPAAASGASRVGWMNSSDSRAAPVPSATAWWIFHSVAARPPSSPSMTYIVHSGRVRS